MSEEGYGFYLDDARNLQDTIERQLGALDDVVDVIITSPPYADLKDYGTEGQIGQQAYDNRFLEDLRDVFGQCYNIATDQATLWIISDTFRRNRRVVRLPHDLADIAENIPSSEYGLDDSVNECLNCGAPVQHIRETGELICRSCDWSRDPLSDSWRMVDYIIWDKKRTRPWATQQFRNVHEHITAFSKSDDFTYDIDEVKITDTDELSKWWVGYPERYSPDGKIPTNIWEFPIPKQGNWGPKLSVHPSPFPIQLVERIIRMTTDEGDVVLDPFAGVGTTLAVAEAMNRKAIGFELNEEYKQSYFDYVRPTVFDEFENRNENTQTDLTSKIWTLRIGKYAWKIYSELLEILDVNSSYQLGVSTIFCIIDPETVPPMKDEGLVGRIVFALNGGSSIDDDDLASAADDIKTGGSGGYYGLDDIELEVKMSGRLATEIRNDDSKISGATELYAYIGGHHHWCVAELTATEWIQKYGTASWQSNYVENDYPPLLSTLYIQQEDESRSSDPPEVSEENQSLVSQFTGS